MTQGIERLVARLNAAAPRTGSRARPRTRGALASANAHGRSIALAVLGLSICVGSLLDDPARAPQVASPSSIESGDRFTIAPENLPRTGDARPLTWGELFDLYNLEDETLRRSLEASLDRPFSSSDARSYRSVVVGERVVTVVLGPVPPRSDP